MNFVEWSAELDVGDERMNQQHRRLIDIINRYHEALESKAPRSELVAVFEDVADYAREHFKDEEALMSATRFPSLPRHRIIHDQLLDRVTVLLLELRRGTEGVEMDIQYFLRNWLTAHIRGIDIQYAPYVRGLAA